MKKQKQYEVLSDEVVEWIVIHVANRLFKKYGLPVNYTKDDLFQEVRCKAYYRKQTIDPKYTPEQQNSFLVKSLYLELSKRLYTGEYYKTSRKRQAPTINLSYIKDYEQLFPGRQNQHETDVDMKLDAKRVWEALDEIGAPNETRYFVERYKHGQTSAQIAKLYRVTRSAVDACLRRLCRKLNAYFTDPEKREQMILWKKQNVKV